MDIASAHCIGCGSNHLRLLDKDAIPHGVASDSKPWPRIGTFVICEDCAHTQKIQDEAWQADVQAIYSGYEMYFLAGGSEQQVFDDGQPQPRTKRLFEKLWQCVKLPDEGRMLDVGCAVGNTLRTFSSMCPRWKLAGFDITSHSEAIIRAIPGVTNFHTGSLDDIPERFDLITMLFVVEHLPDPRQVLNQFRKLIKPDGIIWIHTSDFWANPFDLTVVDHSSHYMVDTLAELVERCGFTVIDRNDDWNVKEMGVVARLGDGKTKVVVDEAKKNDRLRRVPERFQWLGNLVRDAKAAAWQGRLAILGSSFAATWLASMIPNEAAMFVDEDPNRVGKKHLGLPVVAPDQVPAGVPVYLAFPPIQAERIRTRFAAKYPDIKLVMPPALSR